MTSTHLLRSAVASVAVLVTLGGLPVHSRAQAPAADKGAPAPAAVDPIERLRLRLAERLGDRSGDRSGARSPAPPADRSDAIKVAARTPTASMSSSGAPPSPAPTAARAAAPRRASIPGAGSAKAEPAPWSYEGAGGPASWASLRPEFALCGSGQRQSPIDLREGLAVDLEPVRFDYRPSGFSVIDNGRTVQVNVAPGNAIELGGRRYELVRFDFHRPSEEHIDGRQFEMSVHLLHRDAQGRLAMVAVLLDAGPAQPVVQTVWNHLPLERHEEVAARATLDPSGLLPADRGYYTYMGSLTAPPCTEGVQWVVMRTPVSMTPEQIAIFARLYPMNSRPLQAAGGRRILQSQ